MILEKVYDELYGMIEDLKKKIQAAEKSDVTITPALDSGTKVADFEIDGTEGSIYAPTQVNADWNATEGVSRILNQPFKFIKTSVTLPANNSTIELNISDVDPDLADADFVNAFNYTASNAITSIAFNAVRTKMYINFAAALTSQIDYDIVIMAAYGVIPDTRTAEPTKKTTKKK